MLSYALRWDARILSYKYFYADITLRNINIYLGNKISYEYISRGGKKLIST